VIGRLNLPQESPEGDGSSKQAKAVTTGALLLLAPVATPPNSSLPLTIRVVPCSCPRCAATVRRVGSRGRLPGK
jgi:hypothetical protein